VSILDKLFARKKDRRAPRKDFAVFKIGGGWGNSIQWFSYPERVNGWKTPMPQVGDILTCEMKSGNTGVWIFTSVEPCGDPADMFFAHVFGLGYSTEVGFALKPEQEGNPFGGYEAKEAKQAFMDLRRTTTQGDR
jgi:hypothetical protein